MPRSAGRLNRIVVGSTLDADSDDVVRSAAELARAAGARLFVAHAIAPLILPPPMLAVDPGRRAESTARLRAQVDRVLGESGAAAGALPELHVDAGPPEVLLADVAERHGADLIVVGATAASGRLGKLLGSTAERLVRAQRVPILIVRGAARLPPERVLAPVDLSLLSTDAFRCGLRLLAPLAAGRPIDVETFLVRDPHGAAAARPGAAAELQAMIGAAATPGLKLTSRVVDGAPAAQILEEAPRSASDLILIGARGAGGARARLGSVTAEVARYAPCGVLVIPPAAALGEALTEAIEAEAP